jgi:hypothetical protein
MYVTPAEPSSPIPNVGLTPMALDGRVNLHFEHGVPNHLREDAMKHLSTRFIPNTHVFSPEPMDTILTIVLDFFMGLVEKGYLRRDLVDPSKWIYQPSLSNR